MSEHLIHALRADDRVATGQKRGKRIFRDLSEIPERLRQGKR